MTNEHELDPESLPKFLIADDGDERDFIVHLHSPRVLFEATDDGLVLVSWLEKQSDFVSKNKDAEQKLATVEIEAQEFYLEQVELAEDEE